MNDRNSSFGSRGATLTRPGLAESMGATPPVGDSMLFRRTIVLSVAALSIAACTDPPPFSSGDTEADAPRSDVGAIDLGMPDVKDDVDADAVETDADADADVDEPCDTLGCPCEEDFECASDYCIRIGAGDERICSEICVDECSDPEFECLLLEASGGDAVSLCVPGGNSYCDPCNVDLDCGSTAAVCLDQLDGRFCAIPCGDGTLCPEGAFCGTAEGVEGTFCIPDSEVCSECWDPDGDLFGVGEACAGLDCDQENESVFEGAPETCNGEDDDCDSVIDEGFDLRVDVNNCGACGAICAVENAEPVCEGGVCRILECLDGFADCNADAADGCETDLADPSLCGACGPLPGVPGESCGGCDLGIWFCDDEGGLFCDGDPGEDALNACGGCEDLDEVPFEECGTCGTGLWVCDGDNDVRCVGDDGEEALNACGGCASLEAIPETACGTCDTGTWLCDGPDSISCSGDSGPGVLNECGGCAPLEAAPLTSCGTCDSGFWSCVGTELVTCRDDLGEEARNACGGCDALSAEPSTACGPCGDGATVCNGINATICLGATPDSDGDGVCDDSDICEGDDATGDTDRDGICDDSDVCIGDDDSGDRDGDGVCDSDDICDGDDASGDSDGDGICDDSDDCDGDDASGDSDDDGVCDSDDVCDGDDASGDTDGDGICDDSDTCEGDDATGDADGDGVCDSDDLCDGDDASEDTDGDGVCDDSDDCPLDALDDSDGDGSCDSADICPGSDDRLDGDGDTVPDGCDSCIGDDRLDGDRDGTPDFCDCDSTVCDPNASCAESALGTTCTCDPGWSGDGFSCIRAEFDHILVYYDSFSASTQPAILEAQRRGVRVTGTTSGSEFAAAYDVGDVDLVIIDVPGSSLPGEITSRIPTWIAGGGHLIFSWWDLDTNASLQSSLGLSSVSSFSSPSPIYPSPGADPDFFVGFPVPLTSSNDAGDNGDVLTPSPGGRIVAGLGSPTGGGIIALTQAERVIVIGFLPWDFQSTDNDADGRRDMSEMYGNMFDFLMGT